MHEPLLGVPGEQESKPSELLLSCCCLPCPTTIDGAPFDRPQSPCPLQEINQHFRPCGRTPAPHLCAFGYFSILHALLAIFIYILYSAGVTRSMPPPGHLAIKRQRQRTKGAIIQRHARPTHPLLQRRSLTQRARTA